MAELRASENMQSRASLAPPVASFPPAAIFYDTDDGASDSDSDSEDDNSDTEELFDTSDFVSVAQDLLLVRHRCFHPEMHVKDLSAKFQRELGVTRSPQDLETRLIKLQTPEFQALFVLYLKAVSVGKDSLHASDASTVILPEYQALLESTRTSCETQLFQMMYESDKFQQEASEMLKVEISGRNFPKYTRSVSKAELRRCCKGIDDLFHRQMDVLTPPHQAFTLLAPNTPKERLQLTDVAPRYDNCAVFNHLEQPIFDRLVLFAKDPHIVERLSLQRQQQAEANRIKQDSAKQLRAIFEALRHKQATRLEKLRLEEIDAIKQQLERALEDDLQHIRQMHAALLNHEKAKINAKYAEHKAALSEKTKTMQRDVAALQKKCESSGWHDLERVTMASSLQVERIFGTSEYLLRLLILAEDLDAELLRRALVRYLGEPEKLPQFALRRELTSKMIADTTVLAILKQAPTTDLREVESYERDFLHQDLVARELYTRQVEFGRFLAGLTNDRLSAAKRYSLETKQQSPSKRVDWTQPLHGNQVDVSASDDNGDGSSSVLMDAEFQHFIPALTDFPDVLEHELARRRDFSCVKMDSSTLERDVSFSAEDCVLQLEASHRYCTVCATKERRQGESGKWMFEVTVELFGGDGESLLLGWEVPREVDPASTFARGSGTLPSHRDLPNNGDDGSNESSACVIPGITPGTDGRSFGVTWQADGGLDMGMLHSNGTSTSGGPTFRAGDVVGCTIDQDHAVPQLRFYLNGDLALPTARAASKVSSHPTAVAGDDSSHRSCEGIEVLNPAYCLLPVASMYSSQKKPQMRVRFNFRGDFKFPVAGFDPFGAPL